MSAFSKMDVEGITSILTSDGDAAPKLAPSLRRTLSADMSSRKWMAENGFKTKSISPSELSEEEEECEAEEEKSQFDIWSSIEVENNKKELDTPPQADVWSSILAQKSDRPAAQDPPYVHPLVKRSARSLSEKSLQVCTESLGSETGSDGFSSSSSSETGEGEDDAKVEEAVVVAEPEPEQQKVDRDRAMSSVCRKRGQLSRSPSFPPPLPSISRLNGKSFHVRSHRDDGRLVLEAVSVAEQNNFRAHRQDGRLVLTFVKDEPKDEFLENDEMESEELDEGLVNFAEDDNNGDYMALEDEDDNEDEEEEEEETEEAEEKASVSKLSVLINKPVVLANRNPTWPNKFSEVVIFGKEEKEALQLPQSLPALARVAPMTSYNAYEYFWRAKPSTAIISTSAHHQQTQPLLIKNYTNKYIVSKNPRSNQKQNELVLVHRTTECLVPLIRSCKETGKSLLFWEPNCIATS